MLKSICSFTVYMRTVPMCFSILQVPICKLHTLASSWGGSFPGLRGKSRFQLLGLNASYLEEGHSRRWTRRPISTKTEGLNERTLRSKRSIISHEIVEGIVSTSTKLDVNKSEIPRIQYYDVPTNITELADLVNSLTVILFDTETTGLSRKEDRIIEIAFRDCMGGENSTFQTLVNPERSVPNSHIHHITTHMVNRPEVPRMVDLIPILQEYIRSRQKPGGNVLLVAHNARSFDVPFIINEFNRCSMKVPSNWRFMDTLSLSRERMKMEGLKVSSGSSLQALREFYEIPLVGSAHRAMSDVNTLALVLQRLTFDMKMPPSGLIERSFKASDLINLKKKKP